MIRRIFFQVIVTTVISLLFILNILADEIKLRSGRVIKGEIISQDEKKTVILCNGVNITIQNDQVASVQKEYKPTLVPIQTPQSGVVVENQSKKIETDSIKKQNETQRSQELKSEIQIIPNSTSSQTQSPNINVNKPTTYQVTKWLPQMKQGIDWKLYHLNQNFLLSLMGMDKIINLMLRFLIH